jgi:hypothetical protein
MDELERARAGVLAVVDQVPGTLRPPSLISARPLRPLPPALVAKLLARREIGLDPQGTDHPHGYLWQQVALPAATVATIDLGVLLVAWLSGHSVVAAVAAVVFAVLVVLGGAAATVALHDALRLTNDERHLLNGSRFWESHQPWIGPLSGRPERALVTLAIQAVERITASDAWASSYLDEHRLRLDLVLELDQIDAQALRLASARVAVVPHSAASVAVQGELARHAVALDGVWLGAVDRVAALRIYADQLAALDRHFADARALERADDQLGELLAGSVRDEYAIDTVRALSGELDYVRAAIGDTVALLRADGFDPTI